MDWNKTIEQAHKTAVEHGFWEKDPCYEHLAMLVITELSEAIDADRHGKHADREKYKDTLVIVNESVLGFKERLSKRKQAFELYVKDTVEDELADACIRIMDMLGKYERTIISEDMFTACADRPLCEFCFYVSEALMAHLGSRFYLEKALGMILAYARHNNIDIEWHIKEKMAYNERRPKLNGKKY